MFNNAVLTEISEQPDKLRAQAILKGYERIGCQAVNVGGFELAAGTAYLQQIVDSTEIPFTSLICVGMRLVRPITPIVTPPSVIIWWGGKRRSPLLLSMMFADINGISVLSTICCR